MNKEELQKRIDYFTAEIEKKKATITELMSLPESLDKWKKISALTACALNDAGELKYLQEMESK